MDGRGCDPLFLSVLTSIVRLLRFHLHIGPRRIAEWLKRVISRLIARLIFRFVRRMGSGLDKTAFLDLVVGPIGIFLVVFVSISSIEKLHFPEDLDFDIYEVKSKSIVQALAVIILIVSFIWLLLRLVDFVALVHEPAQCASIFPVFRAAPISPQPTCSTHSIFRPVA